MTTLETFLSAAKSGASGPVDAQVRAMGLIFLELQEIKNRFQGAPSINVEPEKEPPARAQYEPFTIKAKRRKRDDTSND